MNLLAYSEATRDMFETACELKIWHKEHGNYPPSLDTSKLARLDDHFPNPSRRGPVRYETRSTGYTVYAPVPDFHMAYDHGAILWRSGIAEEQ